MQKLTSENIPTTERRLTCKYIKQIYGVYDTIYTSYEYFVAYINDVLHQIRNGAIDYVYNEDQLKELLRFEPNIQVSYHDGVFYVWLPSNTNTKQQKGN